jgi:hypothetical protein
MKGIRITIAIAHLSAAALYGRVALPVVEEEEAIA